MPFEILEEPLTRYDKVEKKIKPVAEWTIILLLLPLIVFKSLFIALFTFLENLNKGD